MVEKMNYLITTFEDSYFVSQSLREDNLFDVVVLWENVNEAVWERLQSQAAKRGHVSQGLNNGMANNR